MICQNCQQIFSAEKKHSRTCKECKSKNHEEKVKRTLLFATKNIH